VLASGRLAKATGYRAARFAGRSGISFSRTLSAEAPRRSIALVCLAAAVVTSAKWVIQMGDLRDERFHNARGIGQFSGPSVHPAGDPAWTGMVWEEGRGRTTPSFEGRDPHRC
jgi:hypothetical protein